MSGTAHIAFVPIDEGFVPKAGTAAGVVRLLDGLFASFAPPVPEATRVDLVPRGPRVDLVRCGSEYLPYSAVVEQFGEPVPVEDDVAQRVCAACGSLVPTLADCAVCGVEEDPKVWRLGPPVVLYTRAFELGLNIQGGPDVWSEGDAAVEAAARRLLGATLMAVERHLGTKLRCVRCVWA
jgi:hypothetical protein